MVEAFGPYEGGPIYEPKPYRLVDKLTFAVSAIALVALVAIVAYERIGGVL
jgi:hypothetical protein